MNCWYCKTELIWGSDFDVEHENVFYSSDSSDQEEPFFTIKDMRQSLFSRVKGYWNKIYHSVTKVSLHVAVHLQFLTLLEPLFYFLYVSKLEESIFRSKIKLVFSAYQLITTAAPLD